MIPWLTIPSLQLPFGVPLHPFGVLAALGIYVGARLAARAARVYGPGDDRPIQRVAGWAVGGGLLGAHLLHVLGYHPELIAQNGWWVLLQPWHGISSMGGVLGALAGVLWFFRREGLPVRRYLDALALGTAPGWAIARVGCFFAHDHPGVRTDFPLAVQYAGGARHDLGLYDALLLAALSAVLYLLARRKREDGVLMGVLAVGYCVPRFFFDFLRADDLPFVDGRIFGLTPAQYIVVALGAVGLWLLAPAVQGFVAAAAPRSRLSRLAVVGSVLVATVGCDQATKRVAEVSLPPGVVHSLGADVLRVGLARNTGAFLAAGHQLPEWARQAVLVGGVGLMLVGMLAFALARRALSPQAVVAFALLAGGGLGNWLDRVFRHGAVVDFLNLGVGPLRTGIFNVADLAIVAGALLLAWSSRRKQAEATPPSSA